MIIWIAPVLGFLRSALPYALLFLRSIPDLIAPKPTPASPPYTPPFTGGQCAGETYAARLKLVYPDGSIVEAGGTQSSNNNIIGAISGSASLVIVGETSFNYQYGLSNINGNFFFQFDKTITVTLIGFTKTSAGADNCGDVSNPVPPPSIPDDGLFSPKNPTIGDDNGNVNQSAIVLAPALPLVLVSAILAGYSAAMAAAAAASDALVAIKKIAEGLDALKTLWDKLKEFLDEWEKSRPKKRDVVRQTYGRILGDGALDFFPNNNTKFQSIQLDVVITNIPIGFGRYFGSLSPSRYRYKELGYIAFYSVNQGILEVHSIQFKRTSYQIPELAIGFIYHLGLDEQVKGYAFGTFSVEKT